MWHILLSYMFFWLGYFHFWLDLSCVIVSFLFMYANRVYLHGDTAGECISNAMLMLPWHVFNMFIIHWVITKIGFLYVESEVHRTGNE